MKKYISYIFLLFIGFMCFTSNVFATFTVERTGGTGKTAIYSVKSSIKYSKDTVSVTPGEGVEKADIKWNDDGISGTLTVTFSSADCKGEVTINYKADEGCEEVKPKNCDAILSDARSMIGKIPYEFAAKCASTSFEECQFNRIWTDKYPAIKGVTTSTPGNYPNNKTRHGDGKGHTGLDCSGFVWWIYNRHGIDLIGNGGMASASIASVNNITSKGKVYSITKEKAQPCDLVTGVKPDNGSIPHIGIVSQVSGGMMFIHESSSDDNVVENCYFDCQAAAQGKAVKYWRVAALWDGKEGETSTCDGKEKINLDNSEYCICDTCDDIEITPEYIDEVDKKFNNCCLDGESHLKEYKISKLFCSENDKKFDIQYYTDQCNNELYKDDVVNKELNGNQYCEVFCTEEISIKVPDPIESASGKFFKLAELSDKDLNNHDFVTKTPIIKGKKTCTVKVNYPDWRKNYVETLKQEVSNFNYSQEYYALYDITKDAKETTETLTNNVSFKCTANTATKKTKTIGQGAEYLSSTGTVSKCAGTVCEVDSYVGNGSSYMDSNGNTTTCSSAACLEYEKKETNPSTSCNNTYTLYTVNTSGKTGVSCSGGKCSANYYQVKLEGALDETASKFDGVKIVSAGTKTATHEEKTGVPASDGCTSAIESFKNSQSGYTCEQVGGAPQLPDGLKQEDMKKTSGEYLAKAKYYADQLSIKVGSATKLEDAMGTCQKMFEENGLGTEGKDNKPGTVYEDSKFYDLKPTTSFNYMQVYLDGTTRKGEWNKINFSDSKCQYLFDNTKVDDVDDKVVYTSGKFGDGEEDMRDMLAITDPNDGRVKSEADLNKLLDSAKKDGGKKISKKFRRDAEYRALCTWDGADVPNKITLYPGPQVDDHEVVTKIEDIKDMVSVHRYQYSLYLTTYKAEYETYWELSGLGGSDRTVEKFMNYFNSEEAKTCAMKNEAKKRDESAYSDGKENSPEKIIETNRNSTSKGDKKTAFTCVMTAKYGGMRIGSCTNGIKAPDEKCNDNEVKEVFEFKVVDPKEMFPGDWDNRAVNWKKEDGSWGKTYNTIKDSATVDEIYSPDKMTYSFKLDTNTIKAIKNYNKDHPYSEYDYDKDNMTCTCEKTTDDTDCGTINKPASAECTYTDKGVTKWKYTCRECKSKFLTDLANKNIISQEGGKEDKVKDVWNNNKTSLEKVREKNNWA